MLGATGALPTGMIKFTQLDARNCGSAARLHAFFTPANLDARGATDRAREGWPSG
jgi:hypothetical protein